MMGSDNLRAQFLTYFQKNQHTIVKSAPLIPHDDPSLLFVNAGMVPFKSVFTGKEIRDYNKAASSQKCVRAGGKHNDLEHVGKTSRHHTFFEMLGNFSFADYFKEKAIVLAWEFLTKEIGLNKDKLSVSIFAGDHNLPKDSEAEAIWRNIIGLPASKIKHLPKADNFWQMGDSGPCGPCTEIHYDRSDINIGFGGHNPNDINMEIWNLVFMQYDMQKDGTLIPLPYPCVDTGMGLERLSCVVNNLASNYDTDLLYPLIEETEKLCGKLYRASDSADDIAMRVIADHSRACAFLIADGLFPGNEGRSYVLRRFMRRALRHGAHLGLKQVFFHEICLKVVSMMGSTYKELEEAKDIITKVVIQEEENFKKTLGRGLLLFFDQVKDLKQGEVVPGDMVFKLYETFGFPADLTEDLAQEKNLLIDWDNFNKAKKLHEERSSQGFLLKTTAELYLNLAQKLSPTKFIDEPSKKDMTVLALIHEGQEVDIINENQSGMIILNESCFYGESGGQVGDTGKLFTKNSVIKVIDTQKIQGLNIHFIHVEQGQITVNDQVDGEIDISRRESIKRNHSATHLLHAALRQILGNHVSQKGSLVAPHLLRFDFSHFAPLSKDNLWAIEDLVNAWILTNEEAKSQIMSIDEAKNHGALALFGEKYTDKVRVLDMGSHSKELCGGTHCHRTGDIGSFRIINEGAIAQGIRRIEAITGLEVLKHSRSMENILCSLEKTLGVNTHELEAKSKALINELASLNEKQKLTSLAQLKSLAQANIKNIVNINNINTISHIVNFTDPDLLPVYADLLRDLLNQGIVILGQKLADDKCSILIATTKNIALHAGQLIKVSLPLIQGKGGGRADFAQAGGHNPTGLTQALIAIAEAIKNI